MKLEEAIKERKSVKRYSTKKPDWRKIVRAIDAARYAPVAEGHFAVRFILVSNPDLIEKIRTASQQDFVGDAKYLVVIVSDDSSLVRSYDERGVRYSSTQAGAAIQNFLLQLTANGLVTYWVRYFEDSQVKEILEIPEKMQIEGIFPIGLETKLKTGGEVRIDLENVVYFEKWKEKKMRPQTRVKHENL